MPSNYNLMAFWEMGAEIGCNWRLRRREGSEKVGEFEVTINQTFIT